MRVSSPGTLLVGTHRRAHRADPADTAFGIYAFTGEVPPGLCETVQPGWIAVHPALPVVYAVNETREDGASGISAFALDRASGALTLLDFHPLPPMPCHCAVDATGTFLFAATFGGGSVHMFALGGDGRIGSETDVRQHTGSSTHPVRQTSPHAHQVAIDPANRFVFVPDLGTDQLYVYRIDFEAAQLVAHDVLTLPPQSGPRHIAFAPDGRFAWLINEMSATVAGYVYDAAAGRLTPIETVDLLPEGYVGLRSGAAILVHPQGHSLYITTRSHGSSGMPDRPGLDRLVWFRIDGATGRLTLGARLDSGGGIPRAAAFAPDGALLIAHQCSGTIMRFALDAATGEPVFDRLAFRTPVPVCLAFA